MAQILSTVLDAILVNVELTVVTSISRKLPGGYQYNSSRFKAYTFVLTTTKNEENRTMGILDISF
jgi:hypothetical protein